MLQSLGVLEFGPFRIDLEQRLLFRGGEVVPVAPKAFETLLVLVENHGRVVSKDDLLKRVWPDTFVEEGSLTRNVSILRKLLGENADDQAFIETIPKRGYRFIAPVTTGPRFPYEPTNSGSIHAPVSARRFRLAPAGLVLATIAALATGLAVWRPLPARPTTAERVPSILDLDRKRIPNTENAIAVAISGDGKFLTYVDQPRADQGPSLRVRQLSNNDDKEIVPPGTIMGPNGPQPVMIWAVSVAPHDGPIYFVRNTAPLIPSLWSVPFLGNTSPKMIVEGVSSPVGFSHDGKQIAFIRRAPGQSDSLVVADANGDRQHAVATRTRPAVFEAIGNVRSAPAWSPDGKTIAVLGHTENDEGVVEIVVVKVADGTEQTFTLPGIARGLGWLDNNGLLLTGSESRIGTPQLWHVSYPGGQRTKLTNDFSGYSEFSLTADRDTAAVLREEGFIGIWVGQGDGTNMSVLLPPSADIGGTLAGSVIAWAGERLLYTSIEKGYLSIMSVVPGSREPSELLIPHAFNPSATSDGKKIVFHSDEDAPKTGLWTSDGDGRNRVPILTGSVISPVVTPDDRSVIFRSTRGGDMASTWSVPIGGGEPTEIMRLPVPAAPSVSPDGKQLLFLTRSAAMKESKAFICDLPACTSPREVPRFGKWMPDGKRIAFGDNIKDLANLFAQPVKGGPVEQLTRFQEVMGVWEFQWTHDGKRLAIARGGTRGDVVLFKGLNRLKR